MPMTRPKRKATAADGFCWKRLKNMDPRMIHARRYGGAQPVDDPT
jgi:hypothetical protein